VKLHLRLLLLGSLVAAVSILTERHAAAQLDPYEFEVYPYATLSRGMIEIESDNAVVANGHNQPDNGLGVAYPSQATWFSGEEFTYGLTDRIESAAYVTFSQPSGHGFWWAGDKFRLRGRLFDEGVLPVDLGWYTELEWHKTPQFDDADLELNPVFEKVLYGGGHHEGFEFGYRNGAYYRWLKYLSPGVEAYGGIGGIDNSDPLDEQNHYLFAVLWGQFPHGIEYSLGPGFGLTKGSDHVVMKFNIELERWLGAIFGPSSEKSWFF
jgi:hypothetical protein